MARVSITDAERWERQFNDFLRGKLQTRKKVEDLSVYLNCSPFTIYKRLSGDVSWRLSDALQTMEYFETDPSQIMR